MEICDFSLVMRSIKDYISDSRGISQTDLLYEVFTTFMEDKENTDYDFDNALVCRWMNGQGAISPKISKYYQEKDMEAAMAQDHGKDIEAFEYEKQASELITSVNNENAHLYSNVLSNHGMMYFSRGNLEKAKQHIEEAMGNITAYLGNKAEAIDHFKNVLKAHAELNGYDMNELWKVAERLCEYLPDKEYGMKRLADYNRVLCDKRMY